MAAQPITPDPYIANAARQLTELNGELSAQEMAFAAEANAPNRWEIQREAERKAAHAILARELDGVSWHSIRYDDTRGDVAAKLYATWGVSSEAEPIVETTYATKALRVDLMTAMALHGRPEAFREACRILGESICMAAIDYILSCHETQAEEIEAGRVSPQALREEAAEREADRRREEQLCEDRR